MAEFEDDQDFNCISGVIYTHPEVAWVSPCEAELKKKGIEFKKGVFQMAANIRSRTNKDADGLVKILTYAKTGKILGINIIASNAGEMIAEGVLALKYGASAEDAARTCHAHPTMPEDLRNLAWQKQKRQFTAQYLLLFVPLY